MKKATSFRLSNEALYLIKNLSRSLGISQADVLELAIRKIAREGINEQGIQISSLSQQNASQES